MHNLPKGFYYNKDGALINSNIKKIKVKKIVAVKKINDAFTDKLII